MLSMPPEMPPLPFDAKLRLSSSRECVIVSVPLMFATPAPDPARGFAEHDVVLPERERALVEDVPAGVGVGRGRRGLPEQDLEAGDRDSWDSAVSVALDVEDTRRGRSRRRVLFDGSRPRTVARDRQVLVDQELAGGQRVGAGRHVDHAARRDGVDELAEGAGRARRRLGAPGGVGCAADRERCGLGLRGEGDRRRQRKDWRSPPHAAIGSRCASQGGHASARLASSNPGQPVVDIW